MPDEQDPPPHLPHYPSTPHIHVATRDQQKPMMKMLGRMVKQAVKPKTKTPSRPARHGQSGKKGLQANQNVAIKHKQIFY